MSESNKNTAAIKEIRSLHASLKNVVLAEIVIHKYSNEITCKFVSEKEVGDDICQDVKEYLSGILPERFKEVRVEFSKLVADEELVAKSVEEYVRAQFMSIAPYVGKENVKAVFIGETCEFTLKADEDVCRYVQDNGVLEKISEYLESCYCLKFNGKVENEGKTDYDENLLLKDDTDVNQLNYPKYRTMKIYDVVKLWGEEIDGDAVYIADAQNVYGTVVFAGKITAINEKTTKTGKPYYVVELDDTTGRISGKMFMNKEKLSKMEKLLVGSTIATRGEVELFNGMPSYLISDVSYCELPANFVPEEKVGKPAPAEYRLIFPEPLEEYSQSNLFLDEKPVPECLIGKTFVVVDIETTGIKYFNGDKITEIGAVKIVDGKICERFQTLVNPQVPISEEITKLTGIDDSMVADKPTFDEVLPDFYKFCDGAVFVAHNIDFDYKFIKYMARNSGYEFKNEGVDTLALSINVLPRQKNYKLNTVCGYFKIEFLHHRAMSDAHATAKLFLELINIKKSL